MLEATCQVDGCDKPVMGRGWCSMHYARWRKTGDVGGAEPLRQRHDGCTVHGCERHPDRRGYCRLHAERIRNNGSPDDPYVVRFWRKVNKNSSNGCWPWTGYVAPNGYGLYGARSTRLVHRIAYQLIVGPIPPGMLLDHLCRNRACCNPEHLEAVLPRENIRRGLQGQVWGYVAEPPRRKAEPPSSCTERGCDRPVYKRGICRPHYRKWLKDPERIVPRKWPVEQRFAAKVYRDPSGCHLWTGARSPNGYGNFHPTRGTVVMVHRYSYEQTYGPVPDGMQVHHTCHIRLCVNPDHLALATPGENTAARKIRQPLT